MIRHSLALKLYLYALVAFAALAIGGTWVIGQIVAESQRPTVPPRVEARLRYAQEQLQAIPLQAPDADRRIADLEAGLGMSFRRIPWSQSDRYPDELAEQTIVASPRRDGATPAYVRTYWVRLERPGGDAEAVQVNFVRTANRRYRLPSILPIMGVLAVLLLPPLYYWVIQPIRRLEAAAQRLGGGDLDTPIRLARQDELGRLATAFEQMRLQVKRMIDEKERLLRDISHELRAPLSRMALATSLLDDDLDENPYVKQLQGDLAHTEGLVGELLALARYRLPATLSLVPVALDEIAHQLIDEHRLTITQGGYRLQTDLAAAPVQGDGVLLRRALGNLLDNALKYTPAGGTIRLVTRQDDGGSIFEIADTGCGIPAAALPQLFEPFYRPDTGRARETGGTGLGLAIAKAIVDRHGGTLIVDSREGHGTTIAIKLPVAV